MIRSLACRRFLAVCALAGSLFMAGCEGGKVTKSNFDKLKVGMTQQEVEALLGPGKVEDSAAIALPGAGISTKTEVWKDGDKTITVIYANGKVSLPPVANNL